MGLKGKHTRMDGQRRDVSAPVLAATARRRLRALGDPRVAARGRTFFKEGESIALYGVRTPQVRALGRDLYQQVRELWDPPRALAWCELVIQDRELEAKYVGIFVLGRYAPRLPRSAVRRVESWIRAGHCANWATIDALAPEVLTPMVVHHPDLIPRLSAWARARTLWLRRAAVVTFVPLARRGLHLHTAYRLVQTLAGDREDLMHKASGWLLREAGRTDQARLEGFLRRHGPRLPRTTVRYAIERFPEEKRRDLLACTRKERRRQG